MAVQQISMPQRIDLELVDKLLRQLGLSPHQVQSVTIARSPGAGYGLASDFDVQIVIVTIQQTITRVYSTARPMAVHIDDVDVLEGH